MRSFVLGAVVGAAAMWFWGDRMRARFAGQIDGLVDRALGVLDGVEDGLDTLRARVDAMASREERSGDRREPRNITAVGGSA